MNLKINMKVKESTLVVVVVTLFSLLKYSFLFSQYIRVAVCCGAVIFFISRKKRLSNMAWICVCSYILFAIWGSASYFWATTAQGVEEQLFNMISAISANLVLMLYVYKEDKNFDDVMRWMAPVFLIYLMQSIFVGDYNATGRFSATGAVNQFGLSTSYIYLISLYAVKHKKGNKGLFYILMVVSLVLSLFTGSRKALINLVLFTCFVGLFSVYNKNILKILGKVFLACLIIAVVLFLLLKVDVLYDILGKRIESLFAYYSGNVREDLSALRRTYMMEDAIKIFSNKPMTGIGLNNYKYVARYGTYAHSNYYELLACLGIVGTVLYYIPLFIMCIVSFDQWKNKKPDAIIPLALLFSVVITEFSNISYMYRILQVFIGLVMGLVLNNQKSRKLITKRSKNENNNYNGF